jgi:hypothetical protein
MRSTLLDTNLLLLLIVGLRGKTFISVHKRTKNFVEEDYDTLIREIDSFDCLWITSHCLSEVSNFLKQTHNRLATELMTVFARFAKHTNESHIPKDRIFKNKLLTRFGVSDTGIIEKSKRVICSYTVDIDLYLELNRLGRRVINFNHIRSIQQLRS